MNIVFLDNALKLMGIKMLRLKRSKYGNKRVTLDGINLKSKLESSYYMHLQLLKKAGEVEYFLRQIPFYLPGNVRYVCDFQVFTTDGRVIYVDVKGVETNMFKLKKKQVEALYPVEIKVVKRGDF